MKTCPICHAKTFDDARICFGCLHDFSKPVADPLMPDLSRDASAYLADTVHRGMPGLRRGDATPPAAPMPKPEEKPSSAEDFELPWDEDPASPTRTVSAAEQERIAAECAARCAEAEEPYEVDFALRWEDGSFVIDFCGEYDAQISSPYRATVQTIDGLGLSMTFDPPSSPVPSSVAAHVHLIASPLTQVTFENAM